MNVTFNCPRCGAGTRIDVAPGQAVAHCTACRAELRLPEGAFRPEGLTRCLVCPGTELYVRKDFPQRLGVAIVTLGIVGSSIAWAYTLPIWTFGILLATALVDVVLYMLVGDALMCYRCHAQYRGAPDMERHGSFNLEIHERYRQQAARFEAGAKMPPAAKPPVSAADTAKITTADPGAIAPEPLTADRQ